jgi:hypothetical protein
MFNPILREMVAREQHKDLLRQAEQNRLVKAAVTRQPAYHFDLHISLSNLLIAVRHKFKALARAN